MKKFITIMEKKYILLLIIGAVLTSILIISALFHFSNEGEWMYISEYISENPPPEDRVIVITEKDFREHPLLKQLFESRAKIPISDNLFVVLKARHPPCVSSAEANEIISRYGWPGRYRGQAQMKYLYYGDSYYVLNVIAT